MGEGREREGEGERERERERETTYSKVVITVSLHPHTEHNVLQVGNRGGVLCQLCANEATRDALQVRCV